MSNSEFTPVRPCAKCGAAERNKYGKCKACAVVRSKAWATANHDKVKENHAAWRAANADKLKGQTAAWRAANYDKHKAMQAAWRAANPDKKKATAAAWYASDPDKRRAAASAWAAANPDKVKANNAAWKAANPEKVKDMKAASYAVNADKVKAANAAWRAANPDKAKAITAAWRAANPEALRINKQNRRARKTTAGGKLSKGLAAKLFKLQKGKCPCCEKPLGGDYHLDHIVPLALGGSNTDDNIQLMRQRCNQQKHAKHPVDFMQSRGFLV